MKNKDVIYASTHYGFLNKLLNKSFKRYMQCIYKYNKDYDIWMIRLDGKMSKTGWNNSILPDGNTIKEQYVGDPREKLDGHKVFPRNDRLIFDILESPNGARQYVFRGVFKLDGISDNNNRIWNKTADEYDF